MADDETAVPLEEAINFAAQGCMSEVEAYADCVSKNRRTWYKECKEHKFNLNKCTAESPIIVTIKRECSAGYNLCLRDNPTNPYACNKELRAFAKCAKDILEKATAEGQ
ncbi:expressed hypothetical protein [Trichoplax adhaerens]|uniref:IMS import disulfide relay-system CHCH-CHCH-like Cx9C domain-containing protein n=1 Tax=Trichoplax adhaerens TaxID=10228 RepID=B3RP73_TRIAD|nr:expressed hypothetical protein [Trichoplax adhaerens]EDV28141.1 expressed hypothetical protein [Trichoplax adhaerens]|eukprot:XP_002109975.1 expressed hypothetical protein [Trichoplax adhaerens]